MPYKPRDLEVMPGWIYDRSGGDSCLNDVLTEAWVASQKARMAVLKRGGSVPRACSSELETAEGILDSIREGRVSRVQLAKKAAQAVRKFNTALQCAQLLERDNSPRFAQERHHHVRLLGTGSGGSVLAERARTNRSG
jgi:hypothetical protein